MIQLAIKAPIGHKYDGPEYTIKCMDTGVELAVSLITMERIYPWRDEPMPYAIPAGSTAKLRVTRPDKAYTVTKTIIEESGTILCPVHPYSVATPGKCSAEVVLYDSGGDRLTSATFHFFVDRECAPTVGEDVPVYVDSIQCLIEFVEQSVDRAEKAAERAENAGNGSDQSSERPNVKNGIPPGGKKGQYLVKRSDMDYDVEWEEHLVPEQYGLITYDQDRTITIT